MRLSAIKQALSDVVEITSEDGPVFFIRTAYLFSIKPEELIPGAEFSDEREEELLDAGLCFAAETKAEEYLARCEQCRAGLEKKLAQKGHSRQAVKRALDYLESRKLLDDRRFAGAWIRSHVISKPQGRIRLTAELLARGISALDAKTAVEEFFKTASEEELCSLAVEKALRQGKSGEKLKKSILDAGFSYKIIKASFVEHQISME